MLAMAKNGVTRGLKLKAATTFQSKENAPMPSPCSPEPIWWARIDFGKAKHIIARFDIVGKR